jgi:hypothetical protein
MEELLTGLKENNGKIGWYIRGDTPILGTKPFDYKGFISKVDEIKEKIISDTEISSQFELLKEITKETDKLFDQLETEISKDEKVI